MSSSPVSVVIPTIGRPRLLAAALASLGRCDPRPAEVIVVDQSGKADTANVVKDAGLPGARIVVSERRGVGIAVNAGLRAAVHDLVFIVHDDCTVEPDWIEAGTRAMARAPKGIVTGQVLPAGSDPRRVPSCQIFDEPRDYTGLVSFGVLFPNNMACSRSSLLELGGFDEEIPFAEDCDFCYRWLRAGRSLRRVPDLIVNHHDWRSPAELKTLYINYYRGQGMFYAKHLRAGDLRMLRFIANDLRLGLLGLWSGVLQRAPRWTDSRRGVFPGLPQGLWRGWKAFA